MNKPNINNKRGNFSTVMTLILIVVSAIVIILVLTSFNIANTLEEAVKVCRLSVITQSATSVGIIDKDSPFNINCDKRYVNFYNTRVDMGLSPENMHAISVDYGSRTTKKFTELNEYVTNQVLAEELRVCKLEFSDGKLDIFPNEDQGLRDKNICFVCSEINFEPGVKKQTFTHLKDYTKNTMIQQSGITYYDYLTEQTRYNESMWEQAVMPDGTEYSDIPIDTSKNYLVYVQRYKYGLGRHLKWLALAIPGGNMITDLVRTTDSVTVGITPSKYITNMCDVQAN